MKASDNKFPKLFLLVASAPGTPDSGAVVVYAKTGGGLFYKDDAGAEHSLSDALSNPMTDVGDIIIGGTGGTPGRLGVGTDGQVVKSVSGSPAWADETAGEAAWGDISGTLSDQTDLQAALDDKLAIDDYVIPIGIACSDETTALTTGTAKATFRAPFACTVQGVRSSVTTAPTGATLTVDINESGASILSTKLTIDAGEKTSTTAATAAVISDASIADDAEITIDIDQIGSTIAGAGLKVFLLVKPA